MKSIKGIICLLTFVSSFLLLAVSVNAQVNIDRVELVGDESFIAKIRNPDNEQPSKIIYVSPEGNDDNEGTIDSPFKTINAALDNAAAGTTVYVREGIYPENVYFPKSGREGSYITLKNYPGEHPVITGPENGDDALIELDGHDYIHIEGFELRDHTTDWCYGILLGGGENHIIIKNNEIHNIKCSQPDDPDNSGANAIILFGESAEPISNVYIGDNNVHDLVTGWCEAISIAANCEYINVINNKVTNSTNIGIDFYGNNADGYCPVEELNQPRYCIAAGNKVSYCVCDYATCYGLYVDGARDIVLDSNISHHNQGGIEIGSEERNEEYPVNNIIVRNNLVYDNYVNGITVGGWNDDPDSGDPLSGVVYNTRVYNNTVVNNADSYAGQLHISMVDGLDIRNNIFYTDDDMPLAGSDVAASEIKNLTFKDNLYYSTELTEEDVLFELMDSSQSGMEEWSGLTGETGIFTDPLFTDLNGGNFSLRENSPAINRGDNSIYSGMYDLAGGSRVVDTIDMGAYEYQNGTVVIPTTESTTQTTTEDSTETTTNSYVSDKIWNFADPVFSSYTEKTDATIDGLDIYRPADPLSSRTGDTLDGITFTKCIKLNKKAVLDADDLKNAFGMYLKAGSTVTVYYEDNGSGGRFSLSDSNMNVVETVDTGTGRVFAKCSLTVDSEGYYYLHASGSSNTYVYGIGVAAPETKADAAYLLKVVSSIMYLDDEEMLQYDYNSDGKTDLADVIILCNEV